MLLSDAAHIRHIRRMAFPCFATSQYVSQTYTSATSHGTWLRGAKASQDFFEIRILAAKQMHKLSEMRRARPRRSVPHASLSKAVLLAPITKDAKSQRTVATTSHLDDVFEMLGFKLVEFVNDDQAIESKLVANIGRILIEAKRSVTSVDIYELSPNCSDATCQLCSKENPKP